MPDRDDNFDRFFLSHLQSIHGNDAWYDNLKFIGKGGNGTTFFVTCTSGINEGRQFALKVFHKISSRRRRERFLQEVQHYKELSHPSIVNVYDEGIYHAGDREYPFAVMDFIPENLQRIIGFRRLQLPRLQAVRYLLNIVSGANFLHTREVPIIHRDIKPANILVDEFGAMLGDLGLAKILYKLEDDGGDDDGGDDDGGDDDGGDDDGGDDGYFAMPAFYRTPELIAFAKNEPGTIVTTASDVYQLGLVLYQAITSFNPQLPAADALDPIILDIRTIRGAEGPSLTALVTEMLNDDPAQRPTAHTVVRKLGLIHTHLCESDLANSGVMR